MVVHSGLSLRCRVSYTTMCFPGKTWVPQLRTRSEEPECSLWFTWFPKKKEEALGWAHRAHFFFSNFQQVHQPLPPRREWPRGQEDRERGSKVPSPSSKSGGAGLSQYCSASHSLSPLGHHTVSRVVATLLDKGNQTPVRMCCVSLSSANANYCSRAQTSNSEHWSELLHS